MMTRAQNETCDVITAAAAAAAEVGLSQSQNGDVAPASSISRHQAQTSPPLLHGHRQAGTDGRRSLTDCSVSDQYSSVRAAAAGTLGNFGGRFDHDAAGRHWLPGRMRNGPHGRAAAPPEKRSGPAGSSSVADSGVGGGGHSAPLNLTCQTATRRTSTATPHQTHVVDDSRRHDRGNGSSDCVLKRSWQEDCLAINGVGVVQRRSMSTRSDAEERPLKVRRRTCWSVDNISDERRSQRTVGKPAYDDLDLCRRQQSYSSPAVNSFREKNVPAWRSTPTANSTDFLDYCNDVVTTTSTTPSVGHSSSSVGVQGNVGLAEPVPDRLVVDAAWSRVHPPGHGGGGRDVPVRECSVVAQEPGAADDEDDDALRQLLRLIQQPDGQPVFLCRHCDIVYADRMLYVLHMGLHNVNNPWQCNICGTTCSGRQQFALHALHY